MQVIWETLSYERRDDASIPHPSASPKPRTQSSLTQMYSSSVTLSIQTCNSLVAAPFSFAEPKAADQNSPLLSPCVRSVHTGHRALRLWRSDPKAFLLHRQGSPTVKTHRENPQFLLLRTTCLLLPWNHICSTAKSSYEHWTEMISIEPNPYHFNCSESTQVTLHQMATRACIYIHCRIITMFASVWKKAVVKKLSPL